MTQPAPTDLVPYWDIPVVAHHPQIKAWLRAHQLDPRDCATATPPQWDPTTREWVITMFRRDQDGLKVIDHTRDELVRYRVRRAPRSPLPWPTYADLAAAGWRLRTEGTAP